MRGVKLERCVRLVGLATCFLMVAAWAPGLQANQFKFPRDLWGDVIKNAKKPSGQATLDRIWADARKADTVEAYRTYVEDSLSRGPGFDDVNEALARKAYGFTDQALDAICQKTLAENAPERFRERIEFYASLSQKWPKAERYKDMVADLTAKTDARTVVLLKAFWEKARAASTMPATNQFLQAADGASRVGPFSAAAVRDLRSQADGVLMEQRWRAVNEKVQSLLGSGGSDRWTEVMGAEYAGDPYEWMGATFGASNGPVGRDPNRLAPRQGLLLLTNALVARKAFERHAALYPNSSHAAEAKAEMEKLEAVIWGRIPANAPAPFYLGFATEFPSGKLAADAKVKLVQLAAEQWNQTKREGTLEAYASFLATYPEATQKEDLKQGVREALRRMAKDGSPMQPGGTIALMNENSFVRMPKEARLRYTSPNRAGGSTQVFLLTGYQWLKPDIRTEGGVVRKYSDQAMTVEFRPVTTSVNTVTLSSYSGQQWVTSTDSTSTWKLEFPQHRFVFVYLSAEDYSREDLESYVRGRMANPDLQVEAYADLDSPLVFELECPILQEQLKADGLTEQMIRVLKSPERIRYVSGTGVVVVQSKAGRKTYAFGLDAR